MVARREELKILVNAYVNALCAGDPSRLSLTKDFRYTENCQVLPLGKGLWATSTGNLSYRVHMLDVEASQAAFFGLMTENNEPCFIALRLKFEGRQFSEAEALVARWGNPLWGPEGHNEPAPRVPRAGAV